MTQLAMQENSSSSRKRILKISILAISIYSTLYGCARADDGIEFNTDILDVKDKSNIDLSRFSKGNYIMPGDYSFKIRVNQNELEEQPIPVYVSDTDSKQTLACFKPEIVQQMGFKEEFLSQFPLWHKNQCVDITSLKGVDIRPDMGENTLNVNVPQAYLEYTSDNWVPTSMWDNGVPGLLADYSVDVTSRKNNDQSGSDKTISGNGTMGANLGAWRLRGDWQANYENNADGTDSGQKEWTWNRVYLYRAIPSMGAKLTLGEDYLNSDLFDSFSFIGASLVSDDNMLPPNLRGYAPEVTGVAKTNAKVIISQQGRIIYQSQVAAGPFRIQDLNSAVSGTLDVRVEEQDGSNQQYKVNTASVPYLTRPGSVRYKLYGGKPLGTEHSVEGQDFASSEMSWGINNGWSLYGGIVASKDYRATAIGVGRDLLALGALALDVTRSNAELDTVNRQGQSYRLSYSKRFDETDSQVTFAGYRFSEKNFMSFNDFLNYMSTDDSFQQSKEMYTISFSQQLKKLGLSAYLNYSHQTYWNAPAEDRYSVSLSRNFDIGRWKNINMSLTAYRNEFSQGTDDGAYLSMSVPWGDSGTVSYNMTSGGGSNSNRLGYFDHLDNGDNYQMAVGASEHEANVSGYYDHMGNEGEIIGNLDYQQSEYNSLGMTLRGGITATPKGVALHRVNGMGGTRVMVDTGAASDIPVQGFGSSTQTNYFGKAVITDVSNYTKNNLSIDINSLPKNAEAHGSVEQATLTEGAIGYRKFDVISGEKAMAIIRLADGSFPPFGASVRNAADQEVGIVNDDGQTYLSGLHSGEKMNVQWEGEMQCVITIPDKISGLDQNGNLLLPCGH
ncbi:outer membrane usher protein [Lelliottia wanjuensis]|uniref:outer membrane usher protein n=1 Tax=Lelliottia wanjuensis TaxID=3050585 RepID=UPI00254FD2E6|nr:outer membrane usher protein [Lelliottia sp. V86_10]MDK9584417.1 outer membrane usher protein [Lelliottia sp. V86_10]